MAGQNVPLMLTQGITVTNDSLVHFMPDTTPRAAKKSISGVSESICGLDFRGLGGRRGVNPRFTE